VRALAVPAAAVALLAGCAGEDEAAPPPPPAPPPPETTTRAETAPPAERRPVRLRLERVAGGFAEPVHVTAAPGETGRLYVTEQAGTVRVLEGGRVRGEPFLDVRSDVSAGGERGLFVVAFHPDYEENRRFFVHYTNLEGDTRVVEFRADEEGTGAEDGSRRVLLELEQPYSNHNGGSLAFGPDGLLYLGLGDGGSGGDPENRAQNLEELLGKLLRLDVDDPDADWEIAAYGLRNPWRFSFDRETGDLWIGDVGQGAREEIDFAAWPLGGLLNFGWDVYEGDLPYETKEPNPAGRLVGPVAAYGREDGYSVTGGFVYRGEAIPQIRGRYFYGDYGSGIVWSLRLRGGKAVGLRRERFTVEGLTSFGEDGRGELYLVSHDGTIYRLVA
jgi:glucose/arabinose dehydrogenase